MPNPLNHDSSIVLDPPEERRRIGGYLLMLAAVLRWAERSWPGDRDIVPRSWEPVRSQTI